LGGGPHNLLGSGCFHDYWGGTGLGLEVFRQPAFWCSAMESRGDRSWRGGTSQDCPHRRPAGKQWLVCSLRLDLIGSGHAWPPSVVCAWPCSSFSLGAGDTGWLRKLLNAGLVRIKTAVLGFLSHRDCQVGSSSSYQSRGDKKTSTHSSPLRTRTATFIHY
jgi:hypothetical protein